MVVIQHWASDVAWSFIASPNRKSGIWKRKGIPQAKSSCPLVLFVAGKDVVGVPKNAGIKQQISPAEQFPALALEPKDTHCDCSRDELMHEPVDGIPRSSEAKQDFENHLNYMWSFLEYTKNVKYWATAQKREPGDCPIMARVIANMTVKPVR